MSGSPYKPYYIDVTQARSAIKPAQYRGRYRSERRIKFWRAMAVLFTFWAVMFALLFVGAFNWIYDLF